MARWVVCAVGIAHLACLGAGESYSHDFCAKADQVRNKEVSLENALRGSSLTFAVSMWVIIPSGGDPTFMKWEGPMPTNPQPGDDITNKLSGYQVDILKEAARIGGFTYNLRFGPNRTTSNTDWLVQCGTNYDAIFDSWMDKESRRLLGFFTPYQLNDASPTLLTSLRRKDPSWSTLLFTFLQPLTVDLWGVLLVTTVATGGIIWWLETASGLAPEQEEPQLDKTAAGFTTSIWLAFCQVTGAGSHEPVTQQGRLTAWSWSFVILVVVAAYTANMATFLIVQSGTAGSLASFEDAKTRRATLCVPGGSPTEERVQYFGKDSIGIYEVEYADAAGIRQDMLKKRCTGFALPRYQAEVLLEQETYNGECKFGVVGNPLTHDVSGWLVNIFSDKCHFTVFGALGSILKGMEGRGFIETTWRRAKKSAQTIKESCTVSEGPSDADAMGVKSMMGILLLHLAMVSLAVFSALCARRRSKGASEASLPFAGTESDGESS